MKTPKDMEERKGGQPAGNEDDFQLQLEMLRRPLPPREVDRPCAVGDGIEVLSEERWRSFEQDWLSEVPERNDVALFVPASGAATRMFQDFIPPLSPETEARLDQEWRRFPFADGGSWQSEWRALWEAGGWATLPKGMVPFFRENHGKRWDAMDAHHAEWRFAVEASHPGKLIFTVPIDFQEELKIRWQRRDPEVQIQVQHPQTDTYAWDLTADDWLRDAHAEPVRRPGGHGALLRNLDGLEARWVFIRNIDNVLPQWHPRWAERIALRSALGGILKRWVEERDALWWEWSAGTPGSAARIREWLGGVSSGLSLDPTEEELRNALWRPMRVAAVVPHSGQPGGGPYWVRDGSGQLRPGIVESAELPPQWKDAGTHFNPVEMACYLSSPAGGQLSLQAYADASAYFTAEKQMGGRPIRILERPGLWNGGMAGWLTRFVEVPAWSFSPVKSAWDLLNFSSI